jgi:hypothetical protein
MKHIGNNLSTTFFFSSYGSGYDALGQTGNKDFSSSYSTGNGAGKSSAGGSQAPAAGMRFRFTSTYVGVCAPVIKKWGM